MQVKIFTSKGNMLIDLYDNEAPKTVENFTKLIRKGYYDGLTFHRVLPNFVIQGGCPNGTGTGGPDWAIACEVDMKKQVHNQGSLSMAHAGPNTGGSQFFICFDATPHLDRHHTVFGGIEPEDADSFEVLDSIEQNDEIISIEILESK